MSIKAGKFQNSDQHFSIINLICLATVDDCPKTAQRLPDNCPMTALQLPDDYPITIRNSPITARRLLVSPLNSQFLMYICNY